MKQLRLAITILLFAGYGFLVVGQPRIASPKPKLVVFFLIDQLSTGQLVAFRSKFTTTGFNRLIDGGTFYRNAFYPAGSEYEGCNLATLFSGSYPATHGIISDRWYDKVRYSEVKANGSDAKNGVLPSADNMLTSTIADELKWLYNGQSKVGAIGYNPDFVIWTAGHSANSEYYTDVSTGEMILNMDTLQTPVPEWVKEFNDKKLLDVYSKREWGPYADLTNYHQLQYLSDDLPEGHSFLYSLEKEKGKKPYRNVLFSPYGNKLIRDFTVAQLIHEQYGKDEVADILTVQFSSKTVHRLSAGAFEAETEDMLLRLDKELADLIKIIDSEVGLENTLIVTTALDVPDRSVDENGRVNIPTGIFNGQKAASLLNLYLMAIHGQGKWVKAYHDGQIFLNHELLEQSRLSAKDILEQSAKFLMNVEGVAYALPADELTASSSDLETMKSMKRNYNPKRSGDIIIRLQPGWSEEVKGGGTFNRRWTSTDVPLIFYGWKTGRRNIFEKVSMADVAPTISVILEMPFPNGCEGKPLKDVMP